MRGLCKQNMSKNPLDVVAVENFREYIRIDSSHPNVNYDASVAFLRKYAKDLDLPCVVYEHNPGKPVVVITWPGLEPKMPSILLNNHMDVVTANADSWTHKPFDADVDAEGNIHGRGAQDMKCVSVQYLEAIRRLRKKGVNIRRSVHVSFMPDEETGGHLGMEEFASSDDFRALNVGFALDECFPNPAEVFAVISGEKASWQFRVHIPGSGGHSSQMVPDTAGEKLQVILDGFMKRRREALQEIAKGKSQADVVSINLTEVHGGFQSNVLPGEIVATFDCRFPLDSDMVQWEETIDGWCKTAGADVWIEYLQKNRLLPETKLDASNPFWVAFEAAARRMKLQLQKMHLEGATDIRHVRALGIPAINFSALFNTPNLEHKDNEYLHVDVFLKGIEIYYNILPDLANV